MCGIIYGQIFVFTFVLFIFTPAAEYDCYVILRKFSKHLHTLPLTKFLLSCFLNVISHKLKGDRTITVGCIRRKFNEFRVLRGIFKDVFRMWFQPTHKGNALAISVLALFGVVRLHGRQRRIMVMVAALAISYLSLFYRKLGLIFDSSVKLKAAWLKSSNCSLWTRKYIKSVRDFRVDVGPFYFVDRTTVITVLYTILNGWITVLLAYN